MVERGYNLRPSLSIRMKPSSLNEIMELESNSNGLEVDNDEFIDLP